MRLRIEGMLIHGHEIIEGAGWFGLSRHEDERGALTVFDPDDLPFPLTRYFVVDAGPGQVRAEHASSAHELLACIKGSVVSDLDNGTETASVILKGGGPALWIKPGVWLRLHSFAECTILGVAASLRYADTQQWSVPNREALRGYD